MWGADSPPLASPSGRLAENVALTVADPFRPPKPGLFRVCRHVSNVPTGNNARCAAVADNHLN
jgi:hypothetical protein